MSEPPQGIWRHSSLFDDGNAPAALAMQHGWTLGEGNTPLEDWPDLAAEIGLERLLLKREDLNPGGSHKDRGLLYQVTAHRSEGATRGFVLSSSGNAAVSAAGACGRTGDALLAFVSPQTASVKYERLLDSGAQVVVSDKPINYGRYAGRVFGLTDLRGSKDPRASIGYRSIAGELTDVRPDALLTFSSSGTSMRGILDGFTLLQMTVACTSVQAGVCLGIARALDPTLVDEPENPAGRLGIRNPPDAASLSTALKQSGGGAVVVRSSDVLKAAQRFEHRSPEAGGAVRVSPEGAAVLAAVIEGARAGRLRGTVVAVITGHGSQWHGSQRVEAHRPTSSNDRVIRVSSYTELRTALLSRGFKVV